MQQREEMASFGEVLRLESLLSFEREHIFREVNIFRVKYSGNRRDKAQTHSVIVSVWKPSPATVTKLVIATCARVITVECTMCVETA